MNRELLSKAFGGIGDRFIAEAYLPAPEEAAGSPERSSHMKIRRIVTLALAAVLALALGITAYAVWGPPRWTVTHAMENTGEYTSLEDLKEIEAIAGFPIVLPEGFSDGFSFSRLRLDGEAAYDENARLLKEYYVVHARYASPSGREMLLTLAPAPEPSSSGETRTASSGTILGGTEVRIYRDHYKFVPEDYEKTAGDLEAERGGHYFISFGAEHEEEKDIVSADLVLSNVVYSFYFDDSAGITDDMLIRMASELIGASES